MSKFWLSLSGLIVMSMIALVIWRGQSDADTATTVAEVPAPATTALAQPQAPAAASTNWPPPFASVTSTEGYVPLLPLARQESASQSLNAARLAGDARAPALNPAHAELKPDPADLADLQKYALWQQQQTQVLYRNFVAAAEPEIEKLRTLLATPQGQALSVNDQQKIQRKLRELQAMQQHLQQKLSGKRQ